MEFNAKHRFVRRRHRTSLHADQMTPRQIRAIREREHVSQAVFENYLNVTSSLVSKWERGEKRPAGASLTLLSLVEKNALAAVA